MSSKRVISKIKAHLGRDVDPNKRQVFRKGVKVMPWYSMSKLSNMVIFAGIISAGIMSKPLYDLYWAIVRSIRFEKERRKFNRQLDEEEEREESRAARTQ